MPLVGTPRFAGLAVNAQVFVHHHPDDKGPGVSSAARLFGHTRNLTNPNEQGMNSALNCGFERGLDLFALL